MPSTVKKDLKDLVESAIAQQIHLENTLLELMRHPDPVGVKFYNMIAEKHEAIGGVVYNMRETPDVNRSGIPD